MNDLLVDIVLRYSNGKQWIARDIVAGTIRMKLESGRPMLCYEGIPDLFSSEVDQTFEFSQSEKSFVTHTLTMYHSEGVEIDTLSDGLVGIKVRTHEQVWGDNYVGLINKVSKLVIDLGDTELFDIVDYKSVVDYSGLIGRYTDKLDIDIIHLS